MAKTKSSPAKRSPKSAKLPPVTIVIEWENAIDVEDKWTQEAMSALERELSATILRSGSKPKSRVIDEGTTLTTQGEAATDIYVVVDGLFAVEIDGQQVAEIGPGAVVGERAALEGGVRTATLRATTRARVAAIPPDSFNEAALESLAETRRTTTPG